MLSLPLRRPAAVWFAALSAPGRPRPGSSAQRHHVRCPLPASPRHPIPAPSGPRFRRYRHDQLRLVRPPATAGARTWGTGRPCGRPAGDRPGRPRAGARGDHRRGSASPGGRQQSRSAIGSGLYPGDQLSRRLDAGCLHRSDGLHRLLFRCGDSGRPGTGRRKPGPSARGAADEYHLRRPRDIAAARREPDGAPGEHHLTVERPEPLHTESRGSAGPRPGALTARPGRPGLPLPAAGLVCGIRHCDRRPRSRAPRRDCRGCRDRGHAPGPQRLVGHHRMHLRPADHSALRRPALLPAGQRPSTGRGAADDRLLPRSPAHHHPNLRYGQRGLLPGIAAELYPRDAPASTPALSPRSARRTRARPSVSGSEPGRSRHDRLCPYRRRAGCHLVRRPRPRRSGPPRRGPAGGHPHPAGGRR